MTHRPIPASQENKESCNNFIRTMCFALEYFNINIKPPSPTPTHPHWILFCYILKLKNNISIHFSISRYNLTHEMTSSNVIFPRRQTLGLYTMDFLSSFTPVFQSQLGSHYPVERAKWTRLVRMLWGTFDIKMIPIKKWNSSQNFYYVQ